MIALLDIGADENFMSRKRAIQLGLVLRKKDNLYPLQAIIGDNIPGITKVTEKTVPIEIRLQQYCGTSKFDVIEMATHDIILGILWLLAVNPVIDWKHRHLRFGKGSIVRAWKPTQGPNSLVDEGIYPVTMGNVTVGDPYRGSREKRLALTTSDRGQIDDQVKSQEGSDEPFVP